MIVLLAAKSAAAFGAASCRNRANRVKKLFQRYANSVAASAFARSVAPDDALP